MLNSKNISFSNFKKIFLIAECGLNHNGNYNIALELIKNAKKAGFDAVKFQTYITEDLVHESNKLANYQKSANFKNQFEMLKKYSLKFDQFLKLKKICDRMNIEFISTPFDLNSAKFLNEKINVKIYKLSSADLNNFQLLNYIKSTKKPLILSTGMSTMKNLNSAIDFLHYPKRKIAVLHCISEYPTKLKETYLGNLRLINKRFNIGLSDHSNGEQAAIASCSLGVKIIEKHITLSNNMKGPDHKASMPIKDIFNFVRSIRDIETSINSIKLNPTKREIENFKVVERKLFYKKDMKRGQKINYENILPLRSQSKNAYKITELPKLIGKKLKTDVKKMQPIKTENL